MTKTAILLLVGGLACGHAWAEEAEPRRGTTANAVAPRPSDVTDGSWVREAKTRPLPDVIGSLLDGKPIGPLRPFER